MNCVRPTPDLLFGDAPDLDRRKAADIARKVEKPQAFKALLTSSWGNAVKKKGVRSHESCT